MTEQDWQSIMELARTKLDREDFRTLCNCGNLEALVDLSKELQSGYKTSHTYYVNHLSVFVQQLNTFNSTLGITTHANRQQVAVLWGSIKLAIELVKDKGNLFETLVPMFYQISESMPRIDIYMKALEKSEEIEDLRTCCQTVNLSIVELFCSVVVHYRKHPLKHILLGPWASFKRDFERIIARLKYATSIFTAKVQFIIKRDDARRYVDISKLLPPLRAQAIEPKAPIYNLEQPRILQFIDESVGNGRTSNMGSATTTSGLSHRKIIQPRQTSGYGTRSSGSGKRRCHDPFHSHTEDEFRSELEVLEPNVCEGEQQKSDTSCIEPISKSEYGWSIEHRVFGPSDENPLEACSILGHGALGIVEEVRRANTQLSTFVRKRVQLPAHKLQAQTTLKIIQEEVKNLRSLEHLHIVTLIGSYEEIQQNNRHIYYVLMSPVGDSDLKNFLDIAGEQIEQDPNTEISVQWSKWISSWLICLMSALAYMHEKGVRHQDIKPSNIVHKGPRIYFTDFSSSCAFEVGHTTSTENPACSSPMYAAPEITDKYAGKLSRHGRGSDIFALGCVFCDMFTVMTRRTVSSFHEYLVDDNNTDYQEASHGRGPLYYSHKIDSICRWFKEEPMFFRHIRPLLLADRTLRPTAVEVLQGFALDPTFGVDCECFEAALHYRSSDGIDIPCEDGSMLRLTLNV